MVAIASSNKIAGEFVDCTVVLFVKADDRFCGIEFVHADIFNIKENLTGGIQAGFD